MKKVFMLVFLILILGGCICQDELSRKDIKLLSSLTNEDGKEIAVGMTENEILTLWGKTATASSGGGEEWSYEINNGPNKGVYVLTIGASDKKLKTIRKVELFKENRCHDAFWGL
ncbi:MAG: hypothetical protein HQL24_07720 [Candidatus Omnitrophica bacterium]|nr:hypothetical protein [Candidatus Omnitrophota bacterium]